jgi:transposase
MELFAAIRFDWQRNKMSIRALADKYGVHRRTVRQAIESVVPPDRRAPSRSTPVLDGVRDVIDTLLVEDLSAPRKQRHTAKRIYDRLCDEHDARVSYSYVAKYVHRRRGQLAMQRRQRAGVLDGFVPQTHPPGRRRRPTSPMCGCAWLV